MWADAITYRAGRGWAAADGLPAATNDELVEVAGIHLLTSLGPAVRSAPSRNTGGTRRGFGQRSSDGSAPRPPASMTTLPPC